MVSAIALTTMLGLMPGGAVATPLVPDSDGSTETVIEGGQAQPIYVTTALISRTEIFMETL